MSHTCSNTYVMYVPLRQLQSKILPAKSQFKGQTQSGEVTTGKTTVYKKNQKDYQAKSKSKDQPGWQFLWVLLKGESLDQWPMLHHAEDQRTNCSVNAHLRSVVYTNKHV